MSSSPPQDRASFGWKQVLIVATLILMSVGGLWLTLREPEAEPTGGDTTGLTEQSQVPAAPPPSPSDGLQTLTPEEAESYDGTDVGRNYEDMPLPGFQATSDREPQDGDEAAAKKVIEDAIPGWATLNTREGTSAASWEESFRQDAGISGDFTSRSLLAFDDLWGGAFQMDVSVNDASITKQEELWNIGSHSLWRVTVERTLVPNLDGVDGERTEEVTWDFLIEQNDEGSQLVAFADPSEDNEEAKTFRIPEE